MQKTYLNDYAQKFNLIKTGNAFINKQGDLVMSIVENVIYYRVTDVDWKKCSEGDLVVAIINNIPIHNSWGRNARTSNIF